MAQNPLVEFSASFSSYAMQWNGEQLPKLSHETTWGRYGKVGAYLLDKVRDTGKWPPELYSDGVTHGINVIAKYLSYGAHAARGIGMQVHELAEGLSADASFNVLGELASSPKEVTYHAEGVLGLRLQHPLDMARDAYSGQYIWADGSLTTVTPIDTLILNAYSEAGIPLDIGGKCSLHRKASLKPVYSAFIEACRNDERLFSATLNYR